MRNLQIALFVIAVLSLIMALVFAGDITGDILWRTGIAILLVDIVFIMLWSDNRRKNNTT